jgi:surface protein
MKKRLTLFFTGFFINVSLPAQDFITRWDLSYLGSNTTSISFGVETSGQVNYTWETVPAGATGSGSFSGLSATIMGLPPNTVIELKIDTTNFRRILVSSNNSEDALMDLVQWGGVHWTNMASAFYGCGNLNISAIDVPNLSMVSDMSAMFKYCFNLNSPSNINSWNTLNVTNMSNLFTHATKFNQLISNWNTSNVTNMYNMFNSAQAFNQPIGNWNTANVTNMQEMFETDTSFNQPIGNWNTSSVTNMSQMFYQATSFNQPLNNWNTSSVTGMYGMFKLAKSFNQPLGSWNTTNVQVMEAMFKYAQNFNQDISSWNTSNVANMFQMFSGAPLFNQPIGNWNTSNVSNMEDLFYNASSFNQSIGNWNLNAVVYCSSMLWACGMSCENYSSTLHGWNINPLTPNGLNIGWVGSLHYGVNVVADRNNLITTKGWTITGDIAYTSACLFGPTNSHTISPSTNLSQFIPNPSSNESHLEISIDTKKEIHIEVYSMLGQLIFKEKKIYGKGFYSINIPTQNFSDGQYSAMVKCGDMVEVRRLEVRK